MNTSIDIGTAHPSDIHQLCELLHCLFSQEKAFNPDYEAQQRGLSRIINDANIGHILVARQNDRVIGMANLLYTISTALGERVALLEDMIVTPQARQAGIGSMLLEYAIKHARQQGCRRITLLTDSDNESAIRFYKKHGFNTSSMLPLYQLLDT